MVPVVAVPVTASGEDVARAVPNIRVAKKTGVVENIVQTILNVLVVVVVAEKRRGKVSAEDCLKILVEVGSRGEGI